MNNIGLCGPFVLLYYLLSLVSSYLAAFIMDSMNIQLRTPFSSAVSLFITSVASCLLTIVFYFFSGRFNSYRETCFKKPKAKMFLCLIPVCIVFWLCGMFTNNMINTFLHKFFDFTPITQLMPTTSPKIKVFNFINVCIIAPVTEELLFRGVIVDSCKKYGNCFAIFISALLFAVAHSSLTIFGLPFVMGIASAAVLVKTGNILYCIFIHSVCNGISFAITFLPSSTQVNLAVGIFIMFGGLALTWFLYAQLRKKIGVFLKNALLQSKKYFCSGTEIISLGLIILYYIYTNYSLHFLP